MATRQEHMRHRGSEPASSGTLDAVSSTSADDVAVFLRIGAVVAVLIGCVAVIQSMAG